MAKAVGSSYSPDLRPPRQFSTLLMRGHWKRDRGEILWHRRETRRTTEKTNVVLNYRASALLYPLYRIIHPDSLGHKLLSMTLRHSHLTE